jgi:hypothetical protein
LPEVQQRNVADLWCQPSWAELRPVLDFSDFHANQVSFLQPYGSADSASAGTRLELMYFPRLLNDSNVAHCWSGKHCELQVPVAAALRAVFF